MPKSQIFKGVNDEVKALDVTLNSLADSVDKVANSLNQEVKLINKEGVKALTDTIKATEKLNKVAQQKIKIENEKVKLNKKILDANKKQVKATKTLTKEEQKQRNERAKANKETKKAVTIEEQLGFEYDKSAESLAKLNRETVKQAQTINEATEQNKALRLIVRDLNAEIPAQAEAMERLNAIIDGNTDIQKGNSDAFIQSKINIGNYKEDILSAIDATGGFGSAVSGVLGSVLDFAGGLENIDRKLDDFGKKLGISDKNLKKFRGSVKGAGVGFAAVLTVGISAIAAAFATSQEKALQLEIVLKQLQNTALGLVSAMGVLGNDLITFFSTLVDRVRLTMRELDLTVLKTVRKISNSILKAIPLLDSSAVSGTWDTLTESIEGTNKEISELEKNLENANFDATSKAFKDATKNILASNAELEKNIRLRFALEEQIRKQSIIIAQLGKQEAILQGIADDDTISLLKQKEAFEQLEEVTLKRLELQESQARKARQIAENEIKVELARAGFANVSVQDAIKNAKTRDKLTKGSLDALASATVEEIGIQTELAEKVKEIQVKAAQVDRDLFEQNLDFKIDVAERNRNLLISIFEDDTKDTEKRAKAFTNLTKQLGKDIEDQVNEFETLNKGLDFTSNLTDNGDLELFVNDTKLALNNTIELNKQLQGLGLNEIEINRLKEVITDGKDASKEIVQLTKDFELLTNVVDQEKKGELFISEEDLNRTRELNKEIQALLSSDLSASERKELSDKILKEQDQLQKDIEKQNTENRIEAIDNELALIDKASTQAIDLEIEKNELLKDLQDAQLQETLSNIDKEAKAKEDANKKELEEKKKLQDELTKLGLKGAETLLKISTENSKERIKEIENELKEGEKKQDELREQAQLGNTYAAESLAKEEEIERERTRRIEAEKKKQIRNEMALAGLKAYSAIAGQPNAEGRTIAGITALLTSIQTLPAFYEGADRVGDGNTSAKKVSNGKDGFMARLDGDEMVMNPSQTSELQKYGFGSRESILKLVKSTGKLKTPNQIIMNNAIMEHELKTLNHHMKNMKQPVAYWDAIEGKVGHEMRKQSKFKSKRERRL